MSKTLFSDGYHVAGFILAALHVVAVLGAVILIFKSQDQDWPMIWAYFYLPDFPVVLILLLINWSISRIFPNGISLFGKDYPSPATDIPNFIVPLLLFLFIGTLWWYFLPQLLGNLISALKGHKA